ncbi:MAG: hypothetical protein JWN27_2949 [Candidatus Eremiobacteraeota bacterium]|nr:hypothetical protein [Candidatus Eremiobacteraeota bacterium]
MSVYDALVRAGVDPDVAAVLARKFDPKVMSAIEYVDRHVDAARRALDSFEAGRSLGRAS